MSLSDSDFETLKAWVNDPDQQPVSITLPRLHLYSLAGMLQHMLEHRRATETTRGVLGPLLRDLQDLMPDDIRAINIREVTP